MIKHSCAFTGHREIDPARLEFVTSEIRREVLSAIADGYTDFLCGMARGTDLIFASVVVELREQYPHLVLEAALPYPRRAANPDPEFQRLLQSCNVIGVHSKSYFPRCFAVRNEFMVECSSRLIAVFDGREHSGTGSTICFARVRELDVHIINV